METGGNFINECGTGNVPTWFDDTLLPLLLSFFFLAPNCHPLLLHIRRGWEKRRKKMGNRDEIETSGSSRVYSSCTRIWLHERVYAQRVSIRGFTGSKVPSGSIIVPLCCLSLALGEGGANVVLERRWNGATLWLTVPSGNGQRRGGTATRRQHLFAARRAYQSPSTSARPLNFVLSPADDRKKLPRGENR